MLMEVLMRRKVAVCILALAVGPSVNVLLAQEGLDRPDRSESQAFGSFGGDSQDYWITGPEFVSADGVSSWEYVAFNFWGSSTGGPFIAPVGLPAGGVITAMRCYFFDSDAALNASVTMQKHVYNWQTQTPSLQNIANSGVASSGSGGYQDLLASFTETIHYRTATTDDIYFLTAFMPASTNVRLRGCRIFWHREVSPAPAVASFTDVPTGHPYFRFVEALADAGITGGCGGGNYCVDNPITRGEMAVFLAVALGLHSPF